MKTSKRLSINLAPLFSTTNNNSSVDLSKLNLRYKNSQISNRNSSNLEAYINNCFCYPFFSFLEIKNDD